MRGARRLSRVYGEPAVAVVVARVADREDVDSLPREAACAVADVMRSRARGAAGGTRKLLVLGH